WTLEACRCDAERGGASMLIDHFQHAPEDFWIRQRHARQRRTLRMWIDAEPERKGRRGKLSAPAFQQQVMDWMERCRRYPFTGDIALDLQLASTRRNPPIIHQVAKHYLDVLGRAVPEARRPGRRRVLYGDDRQIKFLYVDFDQRWRQDSETTAARASV